MGCGRRSISNGPATSQIEIEKQCQLTKVTINKWTNNNKTKTLFIKDRDRNTYREYFMESAGVRYLHTSYWRIRNGTSERSKRVRFLIQKQRVRKYPTKHFPCGIVFITNILRHSSFWRPFYFKSLTNAEICR